MGFIKTALVTALGLSGLSAYAACPQDAMQLGRGIGQTYCTATKDAYAGSVVIYPRIFGYRANRCSDGSSFDYRDVLYCKQGMANAVRYDGFCNRILNDNRPLSYGGNLGETTPRFAYQSFQNDCNL